MLIASVRRKLGEIDLICYCPNEKIPELPSQFVEYAAKYAVPTTPNTTDPRFVPHYRRGNKLLAARSARKTSKTLFLDTDTVIWQKFDPDALIKPGELSVFPEGRMSWGNPKGGKQWEIVYEMFDLPVPEERIKLARTGRISPSYFNAGVAGVPNEVASFDHTFGELWCETAIVIDQDEDDPRKRPWVDQISLPVAMTQASWRMNLLSNAWNLSSSRNFEKHPEEANRMNAENPYILHFHRFLFFPGTR